MTDGPLTRSYRSGERLVLRGGAQNSRADTAHFLLATAATRGDRQDPAGVELKRRDALWSVAAGSIGLATTRLAGEALQPREVLIRRGRVVNADGEREADVRIVGETIAEVGNNLRPAANTRIVEAAGRLLLPGGIDPHTHLHPSFADDLTSGSMAALAGGITTRPRDLCQRNGERNAGRRNRPNGHAGAIGSDRRRHSACGRLAAVTRNRGGDENAGRHRPAQL